MFFTRIITTALVLTAAVAAPAAPASVPDVMPTPQIAQDLRSPDARPGPAAIQDLRSADTRDAANGRGTFSAPDVAIVKVTEPPTPSGGLDWGDAGIGAGGMLAVALLAAGAALAIARRKQSVQGRHAATAG